MHFSERSLTILKNFGTINPSIVVTPGRTLRTVQTQGVLIATADVDVEFDQTVGIYDLTRFLSLLSLYNNPEIELSDQYITIQEGRRQTRYITCLPKMVVQPPSQQQIDAKLPPTLLSVDVAAADLQAVLKAASILSLPQIGLISDDEHVYLRAVDLQQQSNQSTDTFATIVAKSNGVHVKSVFNTDTFKLLPNDYTVDITTGLSVFRAPDLTYYVMEAVTKQ